MAIKKSHEQFIQEMKNVNSNIQILSNYAGNKKKVKCLCNICKNKWEAQPKHLLSGHGCPKCGYKNSANKRLKSHEQFIKEFKFNNVHADTIAIQSKYKGVYTSISCKCLIDGYEWNATPHNLLNNRGCPKCKINNFCGENNPRWNKELNDEDRNKERNTPEYKKWRDECFKRDDYTCQITNIKGHRLEVHHIYSYDKYKDLRLDINNGITLSKEIHSQFHSIYGYGNNTKEQWEEFVKNFK